MWEVNSRISLTLKGYIIFKRVQGDNFSQLTVGDINLYNILEYFRKINI